MLAIRNIIGIIYQPSESLIVALSYKVWNLLQLRDLDDRMWAIQT